ncbi:hypothetical protein [Sphingomonas sp.]|uniref:hypothetical protein n=1 Tax=Sphingomonas sp. TaxID=28214 RepID=UPI002CF48714|nr:hypothetical protein [Sphingomonas sp.]HWK34944.1 hypothetical protein [Sphingomonas sp.]
MKTYLIAVALGATAIGGVAIASQSTAPAATAGHPMRGDANGDGRLTRAEFLAGAEARFARIDTNHDGVLSRDERRAGFRAMRPMPGRAMPMGMQRGGIGGRMLAGLDADGDGRISRAESDASAARQFQALDTNNDGRIDAAERKAADGGPGPGPGMARMLDRLDRDGDGIITRAEYDAQSKARFDRMDTNHDGFIDAAERDAMMQGMRRGPDGPGGPPPGN